MVTILPKIREALYKGVADPDYAAMKPHIASHLRRSAGAFLSPDGKYCAANQDVHMKAVATQCLCVDDAAERAFAVLKFFANRYPSASSATLSGLVAAVTNCSLVLVPAPVVYKTKNAEERRAEIARRANRLTIDTMPEAQKNAAMRAASTSAFELSKKMAAEKEKEDCEHRQLTQTAALLAKEAASKAAYEEALGVYANHRWLATPAALSEKLAPLGAEPSPAADALMVGQLRIAVVYGWAAQLKERDSTLDLRFGQGGGGVENLRAALPVTLGKLYKAAAEPTPLVAPAAPAPPKSIYRGMLDLCGQVTDRRAKFLKECVDKSEMLVRRAARSDDSQMVALHEVFLLPQPTIFHDDAAGEDRVATDVVFENGTGYLLETARLDSGGTGGIVKYGALYSLADADREDLGRMIATYKLRLTVPIRIAGFN
ncbi:hypothetical protein M885DRAFT_577094 [Pelagophyceae sp. CCMP2097]|nr:hypothetical protein M885DRAFT_577094 [Pelagophyceae sp. CCMP2097]